MHRLCLLIPDISTTKRVAEHARINGISNGHIHVLGKSSLAIEHLHLNQANVLQTTNLPQALLRGAILGSLSGLLLGLSLMWISPWGILILSSGVTIFTLVGFILGLWISGLVGIGVQNPIVEQANPFIQEGNYLMMIDLDHDQEQNIAGEILQRFPQVRVTSATLH